MFARFTIFAATLSATTLPALSHPGDEGNVVSLSAGFLHPLLGLDHVLAMMAVGLWAAFLGGRAVWTIPAAFVLSMIGGFALAVAGIDLPMVESGIAASILVLGVLIAAAVRLPLAPSMLLVGMFAVLHGYAHGTEASGGALAFALGFVATTILLHRVGVGLGQVLVGRHLMLARGLGGMVTAIGLVFLGGWA